MSRSVPDRFDIDETLEALGPEFESLLERMQTPAAREGIEAAFNATPAELGQAAVMGLSQNNFASFSSQPRRGGSVEPGA